MNLPSVKAIRQIPRLQRGAATLIRAWIEYAEGRRLFPVQTIGGYYIDKHIRPGELPHEVEDWRRSCYNKPTRREVAHAVIAYLITEGRETSWEVFQPQEQWASFHRGPAWEAVNVGDPYIPTLIYRNDRYAVGCWGDIPEVANA